MTDNNTATQPLLAPQQQQQPSFYKCPPMASTGADKMNSCSGTTTQPPVSLSLLRLAACGRKRSSSNCELPIKAKKSLLKAALSLTRFAQSSCVTTTSASASASMAEKQTRRPKKSVSFSTIACVSMRPISQQELDETWIQPEEYSEIERERRRTIHAIKATQGDLSRLNPTEHCVKGLEHQLSSRQVLSRKLKNLQYKKLLLEEQSMQRHFGVQDPEALQRLSELFSQQASKRAHWRACMDSALTTSIE